MGAANSSEDSGDDLLVVSDGIMECDNHWTLDSICSHRYTSNREWFASYDKTDGGSVSHGDDHSCKMLKKISRIRSTKKNLDAEKPSSKSTS